MKARFHLRARRPAVALIAGLGVALLLIASVSAAPLQTKGRIPAAAFLPDGGLDARLVPDFVAVAGQDDDSILGYVPKAYVLHTNLPSVSSQVPQLPDAPVYADDLTTLIGHMVAGRGFIPLGADPLSVPLLPVQQGAH